MRIAIAIALVATMSGSEIERAQQVARSRDSERVRFHAAYVFKPADDTVTQIEVVTEFRRLVLITEQHLFVGDQMFSRGVREAEQALAPKRGMVTLKAQLRFHPQNADVTVPSFKLAIGRAAVSGLRELDTTVTGDFVPARRNSKTNPVVAGALLEADVPAASIGQASLPVAVVLDGKEAARTAVDFGRLD